MTPEDVRERVDALREKVATHGDSEVDHGEQDNIYFDVLEAIAHQLAFEPAACAAEAIKVADIEFDRWYA